MLQLVAGKGAQAYLEADPVARCDEASPRFQTVTEMYEFSERIIGRDCWRYTDSGEWVRSWVVKTIPHERIGDRFVQRTW